MLRGKTFNLEGFKMAMENHGAVDPSLYRKWMIYSIKCSLEHKIQLIMFLSKDLGIFLSKIRCWFVYGLYNTLCEKHGLDVEYFWVLLTGLRWVSYTMEVALKLSKWLDSCQQIQFHEDRILGTKYFCFRILVEVIKRWRGFLGSQHQMDAFIRVY